MPLIYPVGFMSSGGALTLQDVSAPITNFNSDYTANWANPYTHRHIIDTSAIIKTGSGGVQVTIEGPSGTTWPLNAMYIGEQSGSGQSFVTTPVPILFSGAANPTLTAGQTLTSDTAAFTVSGLAGIVIAYTFLTTNSRGATAANAGHHTWYKSGNDAASVTATGYTDFTASASAMCVKKLQVFAP